MIPQELFPPALRAATVEEQLSYLLQRRETIDQLIRCLENYSREAGVAEPTKDRSAA
ncbi:MAG TPA: hypothetical protein VFQ91_11795 [Bryobacteraceae bacterium]|nr:hypothetical protein [Bryobacteraceae bacterium]